MSTNKQAHIRYLILDKCFRDRGNNYTIDDLVEACNLALYDYYGKNDGIKKRQIYNDILFMEDSLGYNIQLEKFRDGKRMYYRYVDTSFSICNQPLNPSEAAQLKEALLVLSRFSGLPQFEWIEELFTRLNDALVLKNNRKIIDFEQNIYLKGADYISELFLSIYNKKTLQISYKPFNSQEEKKFIFHPYYLKQYNCRWFVFGIRNGSDYILNLALDRIKSIEISKQKYIEPNIDFNEYFEDIIGVTRPSNQEIETIVIWISKDRYAYVETKPIHATQKLIKSVDKIKLFEKDIDTKLKGFFVELVLIPNRELESLLLSFGEDIKVIFPISLKDNIKIKIEKMRKNYF